MRWRNCAAHFPPASRARKISHWRRRGLSARRGEGYAAIRRDHIDPIEQAYALCLRISTAIANEFGAHG